MATLSTTTTSSKAEAIRDWNDAYDNIGHIPNATVYLDQWTKQAQDFIKTRCDSSSSSENNKESTTTTTTLASCKLNIRYGPNERQIYDLFVPSNSKQQPHKGIFIFVHGGYWYRFDKSYFSHLAEGPLTKGYIVAMPSYRLCPNVKVSDITQDITRFIQELITSKQEDIFFDGIDNNNINNNLPIILCGHSAGGHLVTRQVCYNNDNDNDDDNNNDNKKKKPTILDKSILQRIKQVISISGVHDLRPILRIVQNENIQLINEEEAMKESPALLKPVNDYNDANDDNTTTTEIICIVGSDERPEFIRQNDLLANIWKGMGMATTSIHVKGKHHFNIVDDLIDPNGVICSSLP